MDRSRVDQEWPQTQAASPAPETTLIADFEDGVGATFGFGWQVVSDTMLRGSSAARMSAESGALRIEGELVSRIAFPWAGVTWCPGSAPMRPVDFSDREVLRFRTRGDGRTYSVMLFAGGAGATVPPSVPFTTSAEWTEVEIPLVRFPATPGIIGGVAFVAQAAPIGAFAFEIDDVEIR